MKTMKEALQSEAPFSFSSAQPSGVIIRILRYCMVWNDTV